VTQAPRTGEVLAALPFGILVLIIQGLLPLLLGRLEADHRLDAAEIGLGASLEATAITVCSSLAGLFLAPRGLRAIAASACLSLAAVSLLTPWLDSQGPILLTRALAGIPEGLLFWITLGMIARTSITERWAAVVNMVSTLLSFALATVATRFLIPLFGINGGFVMVASLSALCLVVVPLVPAQLDPLPPASTRMGLPSLRGWLALLATMLYTAAGMGIFIYLYPLASNAGLSTSVADHALTALLVAQFVGALTATVIAGRIGYFTALAGAGLAYLCVWPIFGLRPDARLFTMAATAIGLITFFAISFLFPLAVEVDQSRRTAVQSGPAQMLGTAIGPLLAAAVVANYGLTGVVYMSMVLLAAAMLLITGLHFTTPRSLRLT
jgi:DHA1 family inner membrane transport protein